MHVGKTNTLLICNFQKVRHLDSADLNIKLNGSFVEQTDNLRYLGIDLDNRFNFDFYIGNLVKKLNKSIGILKRCAPCLPFQTKKMLYNSLILPNMDYCSTVWGGISKSGVLRLQRVQNRALRIILREGPRAHIDEMLNKVKWMSVKQRLDYNKLVLMWRIVNNNAPPYLTEKFIFAKDAHSHNTTASTENKLYVAGGHRNSLLVTGSALWNDLSAELRGIGRLETFRKRLCKHVILHTTKF